MFSQKLKTFFIAVFEFANTMCATDQFVLPKKQN